MDLNQIYELITYSAYVVQRRFANKTTLGIDEKLAGKSMVLIAGRSKYKVVLKANI